MATATIGQLANPVFQRTLQRLVTSSVRLPLKTAWDLRTRSKLIQASIEQFDQVRKELCAAYSLRDPETEQPLIVNDNYQLDPATVSTFNEKYLELLSQKVDLPPPFTIKDLGEDLQFTIEELESLIGVLLSDS